MKAHILQHVPFEGVGSIGSWLEGCQAAISYTRFFENEDLPPLSGQGLCIVLGGPMSANDEAIFPWIRAEKEFIRDAVRQGIPMIGICLGAQLIAGALGARVYRNAHKEIGWFPIMAAPRTGSSFSFPEQCPVFHWHGETFDLPAGAVRLASSKACQNQAFQVGRRVMGLQFHLEMTPEGIRDLVDMCRGEPVPGEHVQEESELCQIAVANCSRTNSIMDELLSYVTGTPF